LVYERNQIGTKFIGLFNDNLEIIKKVIKFQKELYQIFQGYLYMITSLTNNFDDKISQKHIESIYEQLKDGTIDKNQMFVIPHKNKIKHLYDSKDKSLDKLYNRYSYIIKFSCETKQTIKYNLCRCLSSKLKESKSIENIRFEEIEVLKTATITTEQSPKFLLDLFYYGEIND